MCGQDISCLLTALEDTPDRFVIAVTENDGGARLDTAHTTYNLRANERIQTRDEEALYRALLTTLQLTAPTEPVFPSRPATVPQPKDSKGTPFEGNLGNQ